MRVGFFVTCLGRSDAAVDRLRGDQTARDRRRRGLVPPTQTCCGQPGVQLRATAPARRRSPRKVVAEFEGCDYLVAPSGSCSGMIKTALRRPLSATTRRCARGRTRSRQRPCELTDFLGQRAASSHAVPGSLRGQRHLPRLLRRAARDGRQDASRATLLATVPGLKTRRDGRNARPAAGFGGTFALKFGEISTRLADNKCQHIADDAAPTPSCWAIWAACSTSRAGCAGAAT